MTTIKVRVLLVYLLTSSLLVLFCFILLQRQVPTSESKVSSYMPMWSFSSIFSWSVSVMTHDFCGSGNTFELESSCKAGD